ncbi:hypothetical protein DSL72_006690 [Monilinia vaccinii-corymbosi]|uniref:Uncharacterized protein n=1 Tax=Monilinia vaccinii-corymbosi TaxID=61207 RepID=A0A8A3PMV6_9HELO|nr:hypothetical protein DSL72_006690 [Monilinia vaccinii-corymbosi]
MDSNDISLGSIFAFPDKPLPSVKIACTGNRCCNGAPLHTDGYRHPLVVIDCDGNSVDVLKISSRKPEERFAADYLKILGLRTHPDLREPDGLLLDKGAMDHDSYVNMRYSYNVLISSLKVFRASEPRLSPKSFEALKRHLHNRERPANFQRDRIVSEDHTRRPT